MNEHVIEISDINDSSEREGSVIYKKYVGIWDQPGALDVLLDVVGTDEYIYKLTNSNFKKKLIWEEIASKIEARGVTLGNNPCRIAYQKWLNLKKSFISILNRKGGKTPHWFEKLNDILEKSEGKLLANTNYIEEENEETKEPLTKKLKQEYITSPENDDSQLSSDNGQYVIEEVDQVSYADVIAIMQQLEEERREREEARENREKERFDKMTDLLRQQNDLMENLIKVLTKQPEITTPVENESNDLPMGSVCIITSDDIHE